MKKFVISITSVCSLICTLVLTMVSYYDCSLPDSYYVNSGDSLSINSSFEITAKSSVSDTQAMKNKAGRSDTVTLKLFGAFPIKSVEVNAVESVMLTPCGTPFGIKMLTEGVVVIGLGNVNSIEGYICPAKESGLKVGDIIESIDNKSNLSNKQISEIVSSSDGKEMTFSVLREDKKLEIKITPVYSSENGSYMTGIWVRDSSAGIGTLTYYDNDTGTFGGLGHPVCDIDTGEILPLMSGDVVDVNISGAIKSIAGSPGELIGNFISDINVGKILLNNDNGIFGTFKTSPSQHGAVPMGYKQEVTEGAATIISTVDSDGPKEYNITIEKIDLNDEGTKNMIIRVTDEQLLSKTGGIVQGMSGSPVLQNGKLVGAVTHVFVNDPHKGYAIFCEKMYNSSKTVEKI